ncbi:Nn.00g037240.m01.CDS01 [Neocucurbitaria sp. VM-36]
MSYSSGTATSTGDEPYWLGRASEEQQRLIKQHGIYIKSIGYLLHPSIQSKLPPNARIADIATGTGIWLSDLSKASPQTHTFEGFDISNDQFLPADSLPSNVKLGFLDFKKPIPEELRGKFDLVNIRLIIISMGPSSVWKETLTNILALLKPGGAITWTEGNFLVARGFRGAGKKSTAGHALTAAQIQLNSTLVKRFGYSFPDFKELFEGAGLKDVQTDVISTDRLVEMRREFTEIAVGAVLGGLKNLAKAGTEGYWSEEEVEARGQEAVADMESGAYLRWDILVAVGFTAAS